MSFKSDIEAGLEEIEEELSVAGVKETFTWKGAEVPCVPDQLEAGTILESGGKAWEINFRLRVRKSHFLTVDTTLVTADSELYTMDNNRPHPVAGRRMIFRGRDFKIHRAGEDSSRAYYTIVLISPHSGR